MTLTRVLVTIVSRTCLIAADLIALAVTWRTTYRTARMAQGIRAPAGNSMQTLAGTMLRDGTPLVYIGVASSSYWVAFETGTMYFL